MGIMYKLMKHRSLTMDLTTKPKAKTKSDKCRLLTIDGHIIEAPSDDLLPQQQTNEGEIEKRFTAEHILQLCKFLAEKSKGNKNLHKQQQSPKKFSKSQKQFQFQSMDYNDANVENDNDDSGDSDKFHDDDIVARIYDNDNHSEVSHGIFQDEALPLLSNSGHHQKHSEDKLQMTATVLSSRLSPDINALNISSSPAAAMPPAALQRHSSSQHLQPLPQHHQQHHLQQERLSQQHQPTQQQQQQQQQYHQGKRDILLKIRHQIFERKRLREKVYEPQAVNASSQVWRPW